jgi:hypothetical protein
LWDVGLASILGKLCIPYVYLCCWFFAQKKPLLTQLGVGSTAGILCCLASFQATSRYDPSALLHGICSVSVRSSHSEGLTQPSAQALKDLQERLALPCHVALRKDDRMDNNILRQNPSMKIEKLKA